MNSHELVPAPVNRACVKTFASFICFTSRNCSCACFVKLISIQDNCEKKKRPLNIQSILQCTYNFRGVVCISQTCLVDGQLKPSANIDRDAHRTLVATSPAVGIGM